MATSGGGNSSSELAALIGPVARELLGEPNARLSSKTELRYGSRGSLAVDLQKGVWHDHETGQGGGVLDLVTRETGASGIEWLREHGYDLEPAPPKSNGKLGHIVATYDYVDENGALLFQVVRFEPKDFRQRRQDPTHAGGWSWSVRGLRHVPYRLPEITEVLSLGRMVLVVEGEKDADNWWRAGVPATTNAGGAGKWRDSLNEFFIDADVVVIADNDPQKKHPKTGELMFHPDGRPVLPGQDHAHDVARQLSGIAANVRVLDLKKVWPECPPKGDSTDWLQKGGGSAEALYDIAEKLPTWSPDQATEPPAPALLELINIRLWQGVTPPQRKWIVQDRIPDRNVTLLSGQGGVGKTLLMQQLSVATVLAQDWITGAGLVPEPGPVLFITAEDDKDELHFRYDKIARHYNTTFTALADAGLHLMSLAGKKDSAIAFADNRGFIKTTELFDRMVRTAREIQPRWILLDTVADVFQVNERDRSQVRGCIALCRGVALELNTAVILLAHPSLTGISSGTGLSGSTAWNNSVRSRLYLKVDKKKEDDKEDATEDNSEPVASDDGSVRILETMKSNYAGIGAPMRLVWRDGLFLPEQSVSSLPAIDRAALAEKARTVFLELLDRYNRQGTPVTYKERARNFAPAEFAKQQEVKALHPRMSQRKRLMKEAMEYLLQKERIHSGWGPPGAPRSKQFECLLKGGTLL